MTIKRYALTRNGPKRLELSWGAFWRNFTVRLDGQVIGRFANARELKAGKVFDLADGSKLSIALEKNRLGVAINSKYVPGSPKDPALRWSAAYGLLFVIAFISIVFGLVGLYVGPKSTIPSGGIVSVIAGIIFVILGLLVWRRSRAALWIAIILYALDTLTVFLSVISGSPYGVSALIIHLIFLYYLYRGFEGLDTLDAESASGFKESFPPLPEIR